MARESEDLGLCFRPLGAHSLRPPSDATGTASATAVVRPDACTTRVGSNASVAAVARIAGFGGAWPRDFNQWERPLLFRPSVPDLRRQLHQCTNSSEPEQLSLLLQEPRRSRSPPRHSIVEPNNERLMPLDQRMSTSEVLRVLGVNRSTLFRWTKSGRFPRRHASGGWLRSDVESWLRDGSARVRSQR